MSEEKAVMGNGSSLIPDEFKKWLDVDLKYDTPELLNPAFVHWELGPELPPNWDIHIWISY